MQLLNRVTLRTPESVELEFILAGIGNRAYALLVDYLLLALLLSVFLSIWSLFSVQLLEYLDQLDVNYSDLPNWLLAIALLVSFMLFVGYFVLFETLWRGQTPGKRVAGTRVICDDGRPARLGQATLRALLRPIDDLLFIGFLLLLFGKREKRVGDWVAGTLVVQDTRSVTSANFKISNEADEMATELLSLGDLSQLLPDDFAVIREYLRRRSQLRPQARGEICLQLARQGRDLILLEKLPKDMTPDLFLEALYLAYQRQTEAPSQDFF